MLCACASACAMAVCSKLCASTAAWRDSLVSAKPGQHSINRLDYGRELDGLSGRLMTALWLKSVRAPLMSRNLEIDMESTDTGSLANNDARGASPSDFHQLTDARHL